MDDIPSVAAWISLFLLLATVPFNKADDEPEYDYSDGPNGPANWGNITEAWQLCGTGTSQSPIDVRQESVRCEPELGTLQPFYGSSNATLRNRGHDIQLRWPSGGGWIMIQGTNFTLQQIHWHTPSEHSIDGKTYAMEAHLVHQAGSKIAVIGILYEDGDDDSFLKKLEEGIEELEDEEDQNVGLINAMDVLSDDEESWSKANYYRYNGSLTTPPCTEGVIWTILQNVRTVSGDQVKLLQQTVHHGFEHNARPTQAIKGRIVREYEPQCGSQSQSSFYW